MTEDDVERVAREIVDSVLSARAAARALQPLLDKARAEGREAGIREAAKVADGIHADYAIHSSTDALISSQCAKRIAAAIRDLLYVEPPRMTLGKQED